MLWVFGLLLLQGLLCDGRTETEARTLLVNKLLNHYESTRSNIIQPAESLTVKVGVYMSSANYDTEINVLTSQVYLSHSWQDTRMSWDPEMYEGISQIWIPAKLLWRPDILVYSDPQVDIDYDLNTIVYSDGSILWIPPARLDLPCSASGSDVECEIKLGSWTFDGNRMELDFFGEEQQVDVSGLLPNPKFEITENIGKKNNKYYPCCKEPYPNISFTLGLKLN